MFIGTESFQLLVQYLRLLYGDSLVKSTGMTHQTVCKAMMPEVLAVLVKHKSSCLFRGYAAGSGGGCCRPACPSRICCHSRQIRHSFHYGQSNRPNTVHRLRRQSRIVAPPHTSKSQIVGGFRICHVQRKFGLQQSIGQLPSPPHCKSLCGRHGYPHTNGCTAWKSDSP